MDKAQALNQFWNSFDLTAIDESSAYDERMELPDKYITYEVGTGNIEGSVALTASVWYLSTSWREITQKADQIAQFIGYSGKVIKIDGGYLWIKLGNPFAQRIAVDANDNLRRIYLNITVDYLTAS